MPYIFDLIRNYLCPMVLYQIRNIYCAILGKAKVFPQSSLLVIKILAC
jgi:hypothetical protein